MINLTPHQLSETDVSYTKKEESGEPLAKVKKYTIDTDTTNSRKTSNINIHGRKTETIIPPNSNALIVSKSNNENLANKEDPIECIERYASIFKKKDVRNKKITVENVDSDEVLSKEEIIECMLYLKEYPRQELIDAIKHLKDIYKDFTQKHLDKLLNITENIYDIDQSLKLAQLSLDKNNITKGFPAIKLYELFIDKKDWKLNGGIYTYENERGFAKALLTAWSKMEDIFSEGELSLKQIKSINKICTQNVYTIKDENMQEASSESKSVTVMGILGLTATYKGIVEVLKLAETMPHLNVATLNNKIVDGKVIPDEFLPYLRYRFKNRDINGEQLDPNENIAMYKVSQWFCNGEPANEEIFINIDKFCRQYESRLKEISENTELMKEEKEYEIIKALATVCRNINFSHPFPDGNTRTSCIIASALLLKMGLSPSIIPDVNIFDAYDIDTIVKIMIAGQKVFKDQCSR